MTDADGELTPLESAVGLVGRAEQLRGLTVHAAVDLGIVDLLAEGAVTPDEVAAALALPVGRTTRLLRALEVYGVLDGTDEGRYALTPTGERFLADHPESVREYLQFFYNPTRLAAIRHLPEIVAEGGPTGYHLEFGESMFDLFDEDPEFSKQFNGMQALSFGGTDRILDAMEAVDFSGFDSVCDVGGGYGDLISQLLARHQHLDGIVLELPSVVAEESHHRAPAIGVGDRCDYVAGDMFESVPRADVYLLAAILHDWSDEDCVRILSNVREAAPSEGRLLVRERVLSAADPRPATVDMDIWMMLETGGRERTRSEFERLFERAGWVLDEVVPVEEALSILVGRPT